MHIINYEQNGFLIVSADNRTEPILAYSESNSFPTDSKFMPDGLIAWLKEFDKSIKQIRKGGKLQNGNLKKVWADFSRRNILDTTTFSKLKTLSKKSRVPSYSDYTSEGDCNNGDATTTTTYNVGPLVQSKWGQETTYNDLVPFGGCIRPSNGHYFTGCVATAVAQIMKYHEYPSSYNWSNMPNTTGSYETSILMRDLGTPNNLNMDYGCNGSSASRNDVVRTFNNFGYLGSKFSNYNYGVVKNEIAYGRPVVLCGYENAQFLIFGGIGGHCWVADGVREIQFFSCDPDPNTPGEIMSNLISTYSYLHMNWGWDGSYDAWFSSGNFNPYNTSYNWRPEMITNIKTPNN